MRKRDYREMIARRKAEFGERFSPCYLDPRFVPFFESGQRIKVSMSGTEMTGTVGVTTGWQPAFLLMRSARAISSPWPLGPADKILAVQKGRAYVYGAA